MKFTEAINNSGVSAIVYGESGIGKTHFIGTLPGSTLIIAAEKGGIKTLEKFPEDVKERLDVVYLPQPSTDIDDTNRRLNAFFDSLIIEDLAFDNIVLDSATELANGILTYEGRRNIRRQSNDEGQRKALLIKGIELTVLMNTY